MGVTECDLMGIGSDLSPGLKGLSEFKTKFAKTVASTPSAYEIIVRPWVVSLGASRKEACTLTEALSNLFAKYCGKRWL